MKQLTSKEWWSCAGIRALKTFSQSAIGIIGASSLVSTVDWKTVVSGAILSALLSLLTSLAGLPEMVYDSMEE